MEKTTDLSQDTDKLIFIGLYIWTVGINNKSKQCLIDYDFYFITFFNKSCKSRINCPVYF